MNCLNVRELLSEYIDGELSEKKKALVDEHLLTCKECREELNSLKNLAAELASLEPIKAPPDFLKNLNQRIERKPILIEVFKKLFVPTKTRIPFQLATITATVLLVFIVFYKMQPAKFETAKLDYDTTTSSIPATPHQTGDSVKYESEIPKVDEPAIITSSIPVVPPQKGDSEKTKNEVLVDEKVLAALRDEYMKLAKELAEYEEKNQRGKNTPPAVTTTSNVNLAKAIGPNGGTVSLSTAKVVIPSGAVSKETTITVNEYNQLKDQPLPTNAYIPVSSFYEILSTDAASFEVPVTIAIQYTSDPLDNNEGYYFLASWSGESWSRLITEVDLENRQAQGLTTHLSKFGVFASKNIELQAAVDLKDIPYYTHDCNGGDIYASAAILLKDNGAGVELSDIANDFEQQHCNEGFRDFNNNRSYLDEIIEFRDYLKTKTSKDILAIAYHNNEYLYLPKKELLKKDLKLQISDNAPVLIFACLMNEKAETIVNTFVAIGYNADSIKFHDPSGNMVKAITGNELNPEKLAGYEINWTEFLNLLDNGSIYTLSISKEAITNISITNEAITNIEFNKSRPRPPTILWVGDSETVTITQPISADTYSTSADTITLAGTVSDNAEVTRVTWSNNRGGSGIASGTFNWTISNIDLFCGDHNIITVTAKDNEGKIGADILTVDVPPCAPKELK